MEEDDEESERQLSMRRMTYEEIRDIYKSKMADSPTIGMPTELEETPSNVRLDSMSNIQTKPKFGPIIKPKKPLGRSRETSPTERKRKSSAAGTDTSQVSPKQAEGKPEAPASQASDGGEDEEEYTDLDGIDFEE